MCCTPCPPTQITSALVHPTFSCHCAPQPCLQSGPSAGFSSASLDLLSASRLLDSEEGTVKVAHSLLTPTSYTDRAALEGQPPYLVFHLSPNIQLLLAFNSNATENDGGRNSLVAQQLHRLLGKRTI